MDWRPLVEGRIANIGLPPHNFTFFFSFNIFVSQFFFGFVVSQTSLMCLMGWLEGGASVAVAVGVSGM